MVHTCEELVSYYTRHNTVPGVSVLLAGTSLAPEEEFNPPGWRSDGYLHQGDWNAVE